MIFWSKTHGMQVKNTWDALIRAVAIIRLNMVIRILPSVPEDIMLLSKI